MYLMHECNLTVEYVACTDNSYPICKKKKKKREEKKKKKKKKRRRRQ